MLERPFHLPDYKFWHQEGKITGSQHAVLRSNSLSGDLEFNRL